jgi:enoyl reductase-like protein
VESITANDFYKLHKVMKQAETENAAFYEVLLRAVEEGIEEDTQFFRTTSDEMTEQTRTEEGRRDFMHETIKRINERVKENNNQARETGITDKKQLEKQFSMRSARLRAQKRMVNKWRNRSK